MRYEPDQLPTRCPRCQAPAGEPCHTSSRKTTSRVHNGRAVSDPFRSTSTKPYCPVCRDSHWETTPHTSYAR